MGTEAIAVEPDDDDTGLELDTTPEPSTAPEPPAGGRPSYEELSAQVEKLAAAMKRNNSELAKRRIIGNWVKEHQIDDLDAWLGRHGIDRDGNPITPVTPPVNLEPLGDPTPDDDDGPDEDEPPATPLAPPAPAPPPAADTSDVERRLRLEFERDNAQTTERLSVLETSLRDTALEAALERARFTGTVEKAMRVIDLSKVTVGDDGKVQGVDAAVQDLREEIPEWFRRVPSGPVAPPPSPPRPARTADSGDKRNATAPVRPKKWEERLADNLRKG